MIRDSGPCDENIIRSKIFEWDNRNADDAFFPYMQDAVSISILVNIERYHIFVSLDYTVEYQNQFSRPRKSDHSYCGQIDLYI